MSNEEKIPDKYNVFIRRIQGEISEFIISEAPSVEEAKKGEKYPTLVSFPISQRYDADQQRQRTRKLCDWLNECHVAAQVVERMTDKPLPPL